MPNSHEKNLAARLFRVLDHEEFNVFPFKSIFGFSHVSRGHYQCPRTRCGWGCHHPQSTQLLAAMSSGKLDSSDSDEMIGRGKQIINVDWWLCFCTQVKFIVNGKSYANRLIQLVLVPSTSIGLHFTLPWSFNISGHNWKAVHFLTPEYPPKSSKDQEPWLILNIVSIKIPSEETPYDF